MSIVRSLEFYSGIGGLHYGAKQCNNLSKLRNQDTTSDCLQHPTPESVWSTQFTKHLVSSIPQIDVIQAFDINHVANRIYSHNHKRTPCAKSILDLTSEEIDQYKADMFLISPPCQPYTRIGKQLGGEDPRASSFHHLMQTVLPAMTHKPKYILLENVQCFETSDTCSMALEVLRTLHYKCEQFLLSPRQFGIPNQRSRYFQLAQLEDSEIHTSFGEDSSIKTWLPSHHFMKKEESTEENRNIWRDADTHFSRVFSTVQPVNNEKVVEESVSTPVDTSNVSLDKTSIPVVTPCSIERYLIDTTDLSDLTCTDMNTFIAMQAKELDSSIQNSNNDSTSDNNESNNNNINLKATITDKMSKTERKEFKKQRKMELKATNPVNTTTSTPVVTITRKADDIKSLRISSSALSKNSSWCIDIVDKQSVSTCCFTKGYISYFAGTGSILQTFDATQTHTSIAPFIDPVTSTLRLNAPMYTRGLRYFHPREMANQHLYPPSKTSLIPDLLATLDFPEDVTVKQQLRVIGNSVNVYVIGKLLLYLLDSK